MCRMHGRFGEIRAEVRPARPEHQSAPHRALTARPPRGRAPPRRGVPRRPPEVRAAVVGRQGNPCPGVGELADARMRRSGRRGGPAEPCPPSARRGRGAAGSSYTTRVGNLALIVMAWCGAGPPQSIPSPFPPLFPVGLSVSSSTWPSGPLAAQSAQPGEAAHLHPFRETPYRQWLVGGSTETWLATPVGGPARYGTVLRVAHRPEGRQSRRAPQCDAPPDVDEDIRNSDLLEAAGAQAGAGCVPFAARAPRSA